MSGIDEETAARIAGWRDELRQINDHTLPAPAPDIPAVPNASMGELYGYAAALASAILHAYEHQAVELAEAKRARSSRPARAGGLGPQALRALRAVASHDGCAWDTRRGRREIRSTSVSGQTWSRLTIAGLITRGDQTWITPAGRAALDEAGADRV